MEPATFYVLYAIGAGAARLSNSQHFPTMVECEQFQTRVLERKPANYAVFQHACVPQGAWPPKWVMDQPIHGVPLDPQFMPSVPR